MNRQQIAANIRDNLADRGVKSVTANSINESIQDGYNEVVGKSLCLVKSVVLSWQSQITYPNFQAMGVTDYLGTIAIFNYNTNLWLEDNLTFRDLDRIRPNWETWEGNPRFWLPHSLTRITIAPRLSNAYGTFKLVYWANAPTLAGDLDVPLIASDMQSLLEDYATADQLETLEEPKKASFSWGSYKAKLELYKQRVMNLASIDLLQRL